MSKKLTTEEFIRRAKEVHGGKYDYSKVEYKTSKDKVCIICPEHGEFWQDPFSHLSGRGCPICGSENRGAKRSDRMSTEEFIAKAREVHGDKYDYSKTIYERAHKKVCIICPEHGEFWQLPQGHLKGCGCQKCAQKYKSNLFSMGLEEFIRRAKEIHGDKYDYSKVEYVNANKDVCIICPEHGEFWQKPYAHLSGAGCLKCKRPNANMSTEEFIAKAREVHGDKYDYSKTNYVDTKTKICIICPEHGEFWQYPHYHLKGYGCPKCKTPNWGMTTEEFIAKAREVHGDKYDYSKTNYVNSDTKVCIICHEKDQYGIEHGEFWQIPYNHLKGCGCHKCKNPNADMTTEEFIRRAKEIHGDKYDYSKVEYVNTKTPVCIICQEHGEFWQLPYLHLNGTGCPNCVSLRKNFKFNLLQEFESEYAFREFLANNDINILQVILRNVEPKYEPLKKDIEKVLANAESMNPIRALEEKYSSDNGDDEEPIDNETTTREEPIQNTPDLDDDDAMSEFINTMSGNNEQEEKEEPTIEEITRSREEEIKVINRIEHMLTPEDREYIMDKFLHDKRKAWMAERERNK